MKSVSYTCLPVLETAKTIKNYNYCETISSINHVSQYQETAATVSQYSIALFAVVVCVFY